MSRQHHTVTGTTSGCILIVLVTIFATLPDRLIAECDPLGLINHDDYLVDVGFRYWEPTVGIEDCGRFIVAYRARIGWSADLILARRFLPDGSPWGNEPIFISEFDEQFTALGQTHSQPSVAVSRSGNVHLAWITACGECRWPPCPEGPCEQVPNEGVLLQQSFFSIDSPPNPVGIPVSPSDTRVNSVPSAGVSNGASRVAWQNHDTFMCPPTPDENAALHGPNRDEGDPVESCDCSVLGFGCSRAWQPCLSMRSDGYYCLVWAQPEDPISLFTPYDILLQATDLGGSPIGSTVLVNDPTTELVPSDQISPAVAMDDFGNVVVVWASINLQGCFQVSHIFARRFKFDPIAGLRDPDPAAGEGPVGPFTVDTYSLSGLSPLAPATAHPSVALTMEEEHAGRFIVVWNSTGDAVGVASQIQGIYFDADGRPMGKDFRVNVSNQPIGDAGSGVRRLAESGRHTVVYGAQGQAMVAWEGRGGLHQGGFFQDNYNELRVTILPEFIRENQENAYPCNKGDVNRDGFINGLDIQPFVDFLLATNPPKQCFSLVQLCPFDLNNDGDVTVEDIPCFVATLLMGFHTCELPPLDIQIIDCNGNEVPDDEDIANETSADVNENGIPDECELDCNTNGVPDDYDILTEASADCNGNGIPDECEYDCNENGVPDDCDVDPSDPDGDEWVSPDCNGNEYPDECDLKLGPPFGSFDCNENGIPDECDIAACEDDPACDDCNENGIPDECDIAAETSEDANTNGIPDECEGEMMMGGGESMRMSGGDEADSSFEDSFDEAAAWEVFYDWAYEQCWGGDCEESTAEQFRRMIDKKRELGLPLDRDW